MFGLMMLMFFGFMMSFHPLIMGLFLMISTSLVAFSTYFIFSFSWYSYIMILVFLGGMLILFIYIASLASNETMSFKISYLLFGMILLLIPTSDWVMVKGENVVNKIYNFIPISMITLFLASYLLLTFIAITKIVSVEMGPLREYS
uniref:NADH dehydrogenase subunit 6 n=1 Tax=Scorpiops tibetanus TaxID=500600 RepID=A0A7L9CVW4_SCOTI|nr:NADH dehydrogenase subunit 6 [Scorpiops tibetanus]QOJ45418.1 NADH dehydrogenase subunit 6 [Scorpiops tibetanus]